MDADDPIRERGRQRLRRAATAAAVTILAGILVACGGHHACPHHGCRHHGFSSDATRIQAVTTQVGGKNVFIPSTIVVTSGMPHTLSIFNTTDAPHGFRIPALGIEEVLPAQEEHAVELRALGSPQVLQINCHLHPPHRTATLVVLPGHRQMFPCVGWMRQAGLAILIRRDPPKSVVVTRL